MTIAITGDHPERRHDRGHRWGSSAPPRQNGGPTAPTSPSSRRGTSPPTPRRVRPIRTRVVGLSRQPDRSLSMAVSGRRTVDVSRARSSATEWTLVAHRLLRIDAASSTSELGFEHATSSRRAAPVPPAATAQCTLSVTWPNGDGDFTLTRHAPRRLTRKRAVSDRIQAHRPIPTGSVPSVSSEGSPVDRPGGASRHRSGVGRNNRRCHRRHPIEGNQQC